LFELDNFDAIQIGLASPEQIRKESLDRKKTGNVTAASIRELDIRV
jgi:hypothetical protein